MRIRDSKRFSRSIQVRHLMSKSQVSLQRKGEVKDLVAEYGHVIVDECHHLSAVSFEQVMRQAKARYVVGLTATPTRKDGHHTIIFMQCGPIRFNLSARDAAARSPFRHLVVPKHTTFRPPPEASDFTIHAAYAALATDSERNRQIVGDILDAVGRGRTPLVLTGRTEHLERLAAGLSSIEHVLIMKGGMGKKQRQAASDKLASIPEGIQRVILATGSYIGEGFDDSRLDTLFLTPCRFPGAAHYSNTSAASIVFTTERESFRSTIMWIRLYPCWLGCLQSG